MKHHRIPVRTLIIDDDPQVGRRLHAWLTDAGHEVITTTEAASGLELAGRLPCQLVLVDLRMPDVSGVEVVAQLAAATPQTRILALSAFPDTEQVLQAIRAGACDLLTKPIQRDTLLSTVDRELTRLGIVGQTEEAFHTRLGRRLRALRQADDRTLQDVASAAGITPAQLSQIELGRNGTSAWTLARLSSALGKPLSEVVAEL